MKVAAFFNMPELAELLRSCKESVQARGRKLEERGGVTSLWLASDWTSVGAVVTSETTRVSVSLSREENGWQGACSCSVGYRCEHVAALACRLLKTKGGVIDDVDVVNGAENDFWEDMLIRLGRALTSAEHRLADSLQRLYEVADLSYDRARAALSAVDRKWGKLSYGDIHALEARDCESAWELWERLAVQLSNRGIPLPEPLDKITDVDGASRRQQEEQQRRQAEAWRRTIRELPQKIGRIQPSPPIDLQISLVDHKPVFGWKLIDSAKFRPLTERQVNLMRQDEQAGRLNLTPEATILWAARKGSMEYGWSYRSLADDEAFRATLNSLFASPLLREKIVNAKEQPFRREGRRLHWTGKQLENGNYQLRLDTDEGPVRETLLALPGTPWFYVGAEELFSGPTWWETGVYDPNSGAGLEVPRDVIESAEGIQFLHAIGAPMPPAIADKVEIRPLQLRFVCSLVPGRGVSEYINIAVEAHAGKQVEKYAKDGWWTAERATMGELTVITREQCDLMPGLWGELPVKWDRDAYAWRMRLTKNAPGRFVEWAQSLPPKVEVVAEGELATLLRDPVSVSAVLDCEPSGVDWFDLKIVLNSSETELTEAEMRELLNARGGFVRIAGKGWRRLELALSGEDLERMSELGIDAQDFSGEPQRLHVLQLANPAARELLPEQQSTEILRRAGELKTRVAPAIPPGIHAALRPYQIEGYHFLAYLTENRFGGILADDMGLGKTLQTLVWLAWLRETELGANGEALPPSLVVCPKSVMDNWRIEAERFLPSLNVMVWQGTDDDAFETAVGEMDLVVINYTQMRGLGDVLERLPWLAAILDEGQYIKNPTSQTARTARKLQARHRLVLTGTPIENRLMDLWSLMSFAMPGILGPHAQFAKRFNEKQDPLARVRLSARVRPFLLRRTKQQVAPDLPDRIEEDLFCDLEGVQQTLYRAELKKAQAILLKIRNKSDLDRNRFTFLTSLTRLRQICCHSRLVAPKRRGESAKLEALVELLEPLMEEGQKVLVFSQFVSMLEIIRDEVASRGWHHFLLTGQTENRGALVDDFQRHEGGSLFLISLKAGGSGLNLTAASYVVLFDPWWNPAVENQAIDRTHRIGQTSKVIAYRLIARNTVEQKIRALQQSKSALASDILGEEKFAAALTLDDFKFLLEGSDEV